MCLGPTDERLLEVLDEWVEEEGIVEAGERLGVSYRTAAKSHEFRRVSAVDARGATQVRARAGGAGRAARGRGEDGGGGKRTGRWEGPHLQESEQDLRDEVEALRAEVVDLRERRRDQELAWRRRALHRLRWQLPLTWGLHWLLRLLTLGPWGRRGPSEPHTDRSGSASETNTDQLA